MNELIGKNIVLKMKGVDIAKPFFHNGKLENVEETGVWIDDIYDGLFFARFEDILSCREMNRLDYINKANKTEKEALKLKLKQVDDKFMMKFKKKILRR